MNPMKRLIVTALLSLFSLPGAFAATGMYFIHTDHLGTPQAMTDSSRAVVWEASHTPFGELHRETGAIPQPLRFPGQYDDGESGYHYNYFRDYDPSIGRYVQSDPIGLEGGINTYAYVGGNPLYWSDPSGLEPGRFPDGNYWDNDALYNPSWQSQIDNAYSQVGYGISEGWMYNPAIAMGAGEGILGFASFAKACKLGVEGAAQRVRSWFVTNTAIQSADDVLRPGGNLIGTVAKGATPNIRTVTPQEFAKLQEQLLKGTKQSGQYAGGKGTWHELPGGGRVGVRTSDKSGVTLDIDIPGMPSGLKVHQQ